MEAKSHYSLLCANYPAYCPTSNEVTLSITVAKYAIFKKLYYKSAKKKKGRNSFDIIPIVLYYLLITLH